MLFPVPEEKFVELQDVEPCRQPLPPLLEAISGGVKPATAAAYRADLSDFFRGDLSQDALIHFVSLTPDQISAAIEEYKASLRLRGLKPATLNRRLAALRALVKCASLSGMESPMDHTLIRGEQVRKRRAARTLPVKHVRELLDTAGTNTLRGLRDTAILRLLCGSALRPSELVALNVADFEERCARIRVSGRSGDQVLPLNVVSARLIGEYLRASGHAQRPDAPLFCNLDHRPEHRGARITVKGIQHLVSGYGRQIGVPITASMLRYTAVKTALAVTGGDIDRASRCCRMTDMRTIALWERERRSELRLRPAAPAARNAGVRVESRRAVVVSRP